MNFFAMADDKSRIVYTPMVWIYVVLTVALTSLTFMYYYWLLRRDDGLFQRFAPKVRIDDLKMLVRRATKSGPGVELQGLEA